MSKAQDKKALLKAIKGLTAIQARMAAILLRERGLKSALEFIDKVKEVE